MEPRILTIEQAITFQEAHYWMSALAVWLDQQEGPLRFKGDADSFLDPKSTARVLELFIPCAGRA